MPSSNGDSTICMPRRIPDTGCLGGSALSSCVSMPTFFELTSVSAAPPREVTWDRRLKRAVRAAVLSPLGWVCSPLLHALLWAMARGRPVRIGRLNGKGRISVMISYIEPFMRQLQLDGVQRPYVVIIDPGRVPNEQLAAMYRRVLFLADDRHPWLRRLFLVMFHLLDTVDSPAVVRLSSGVTRASRDAWEAGTPVLQFTPEERARGEALRRSLGVPEGGSHVCFGLREDAYYAQFRTGEARERRNNREALTDYSVRNPDLRDYVPMARQCAAVGHRVIRMGSVVGRAFPCEGEPGIVDYASTSRTPFGDVYLLATCRFVVAGGAALWWFAGAFNQPVVHTDSYFLPFRPVRSGNLFIPVTLWLIEERRLLTFAEMLDLDNDITNTQNLRRFGLELVHNTPDEICAVVREMEDRLAGAWTSNALDEELQTRFNALYRPGHMGFHMPGRIGAEFLRQHSDLL